jgi:uncharacterized protein (DUF4415 family)
VKKEYDFSIGKRGAAISTQGKTQVTIYLDDQILRALKAQSARTGKGFQALINESLARSFATSTGDNCSGKAP